MPVIPKYRLTYFNIQGRAEIARLLFHEAGEAFEDHRIEFAEWPALKAHTPFGQLPLLEVNGKQLAQSNTIVRFLAHRFGLAGRDEWEEAQVDEFLANVADVMSKLMPWRMEKDPEKKAEIYQEIMKSAIMPYLLRLEKQLEDSKSHWIIGSNITVADILIYSIITMFKTLKAFVASGGLNMKHLHRIKLLVEQVANRPNIKNYVANRPHSDV